MNKCQSPAIYQNMCESCLEGLLENYANTEVRQTARITELLDANIQRVPEDLAKDALIVQIKHDLDQANHREAAALREANNLRQMLLISQQQQISE